MKKLASFQLQFLASRSAPGPDMTERPRDGGGARGAALLTILFLCFAVYSAHGAVPLSPGKGITVVSGETEAPQWKKRWDEARDFAQSGNFAAATEKYREVLKEKPHIEEVKWELCRVLIAAGDLDGASLLLEKLLEADPDHIEYLISSGDIALLSGKFEQAVSYFGSALEQNPTGTHSSEALSGLVKSLLRQGKSRYAIPLMEQLYQRGSTGPELLIELARACAQVGMADKAAFYYLDLVRRYRVQPQIIKETAELLEQVNSIDEAAQQWLRYLEYDPGYHSFRIKLVDYLLENGKNEQALPHMIYLAEHGIDRKRYLLQIANTYLYVSGRPDRALNYFEMYQSEFPGGVDVSSQIADIQTVLANDLLTIVENDGVWLLWRDLARVTPGRIGIYRAMASLLADLDKKEELLEVLKIIAIHEPDDIETHERIARLYQERGDFETCLIYLDTVAKQAELPPSYYLLRARCEGGTGRETGMLASYSTYLRKQPGDEEVRLKAVDLAGALGLTDVLEQLYTVGLDQTSPAETERFSLKRRYAQALVDNQLYTAANRIIDELITAEEKGSRQEDLLIWQAAVYLEQGRVFQAERVLRVTASRFPQSAKPLLALTDLSLEREDAAAAATWLAASEETIERHAQEHPAVLRSELAYNSIRLKSLKGNNNEASAQGSDYLSEQNTSGSMVPEDARVVLFLALQDIRGKRYEDSLELLNRFIGRFPSDKTLQAAAELAHRGLKKPRIEKPGQKPENSDKLTLTQHFALVELLLRLPDEAAALQELHTLQERLPHSVRISGMIARVHFAQLAYVDAYRTYRTLQRQFPKEQYFSEQIFRIEYLQGHAQSIIDAYAADAGQAGDGSRGPSALASADPSVRLLLARALWSENSWDKSLEIYGALQQELASDIKKLVTSLEGLETVAGFREKSFFGALFRGTSDWGLVEMIMKPDFFIPYRGTEIARISSRYYDTYRWSAVVKKEHAAKRALQAKEFYEAEKNFEDLFDEYVDVQEEVYPDLATVYGRLGRNKKEAEVVAKIKEKKIEVPDLKEAVERNVRQRQPRLSFDFRYKEEKGRDGFKNITKKYSGISLELMPSPLQEAGFWFARNEYGNSEASTLAKSNDLLARYSVLLFDTIDAEAQFGFEDFDTDGKSFIVYDISARGRLEDRVGFFASLRQHPVEDTIESLAEGIYQNTFAAGLTLDILPRIFLGFDFSMYDYSDSNDGRLFNLWASYRLFGEASSFALGYDYEKRENSVANEGSYPDTTSMLDSPDATLSYWSPGNYWQHLVSAEYRIELWPTGRLQSGTGSLSVRYGIGYEKDDTVFQTGEMNILVELGAPFLVKGTLSGEWSGAYDRFDALISLAYRW